MERYLELEKCCGRYPDLIYRKSDGARKIVCPACGNETPYYMTAGLSANKAWNELRVRQADLLTIVEEE